MNFIVSGAYCTQDADSEEIKDSTFIYSEAGNRIDSRRGVS